MDPGLSGRVRRTLNEEAAAITEDDLANALGNREAIIRKVLGSRHLARFISDVKLLFELLRDHISRRYASVPWHTLAAAAALLLYILNPFDMVPDFIPGVGYIDDGAMVMLAMKMVGRDLEKYRLWRRSQD